MADENQDEILPGRRSAAEVFSTPVPMPAPEAAAAPALSSLEKEAVQEALLYEGSEGYAAAQADPQAAVRRMMDRRAPKDGPTTETSYSREAEASAILEDIGTANDERASSFADKVGRAWAAMPINEWLRMRAEAPDFVADPTWSAQITNEMLAPFTDEEQDELVATESKEEWDYIAARIKARREDMAVVMQSGIGTGVAAMLAAGLIDPVSWAAGAGVGKALALGKIGSVSLAAAGRGGAAAASAIGEVALGNVGLSLIEQGLRNHYSLGDTAMAIGISLPIGGVLGGLQFRAGRAAERDIVVGRLVEEHMRDAAAYNDRLLKAAEQRLGEGYTPDELSKAMKDIEAEWAAKEVDRMSTAPTGQNLLPEVDDNGNYVFREDLLNEYRGTSAVDEGEVLLDTIETKFPDATQSRIEGTYSPQHLYSQQFANGTPEQKVEVNESWKAVTGMTLDETIALPPGVHLTPSAKYSPEMQRLAAIAEDLNRKYGKPGHRIVLGMTDDPNRGGAALTMNEQDVSFILMNTMVGNSSLYRSNVRTLVHEIGHTIFNQWYLEMPVALRNRILREWSVVSYGIRHKMADSISGRYSATDERLINPKFNKTPGQKRLLGDDEYYESIDEYAAEQFVMHLEKLYLDGKLEGMTPGLMQGLKDMLKKALAFLSEPLVRRYSTPDGGMRTLFDDLFSIENGGKRAPWVENYYGKQGTLPVKPTSSKAAALMNEDRVPTADEAPDGPPANLAPGTQGTLLESTASTTAAPQQDPLAGVGPGPASGKNLKPMPTEEEMAQRHIAAVFLRMRDFAKRWGFNTSPIGTLREQQHARAMLELAKRAEDWVAANPYNRDALDVSLGRAAPSLGSTARMMLKSKNPILNMIAGELLENPSSASAKSVTASVNKYMLEHQIVGSSAIRYESSLNKWRTANGHRNSEDYLGDQSARAAFNKKVYEEMHRRQDPEYKGSADPHIREAADALEESFTRALKMQRQAKTPGWKTLPAQSRGYVPHVMSPQRLRDLSPEHLDVLLQAMHQQFRDRFGFDPVTADNLASRYIDRVRRDGLRGFNGDMNASSTYGVGVLEEVIDDMGLTPEQASVLKQKVHEKGPNYTKARYEFDMLTPYTAPNGETVRLIDVFETDALQLMRAQSQKVSGEVALHRRGINGRAGLSLIRDALHYGPTDAKPTIPEIEAFEQVAAEFLGDPFGQMSVWTNRATQLTSLLRLGGMGITQFGEYSNALASIGIARTFSAIASFARLRREAYTLARGGDIGDSMLRDIEKWSGVNFGTDMYQMRMPFDDPAAVHQLYGKEKVTMVDRLLRGAQHAQMKIGAFRAIHAAQSRGMAEQIADKAAGYIRDGGNDVHLRAMGFDDALLERLRAANFIQWDGNRVARFDFSKLATEDAEAFVQSIHRGTRQIIQGTFIGETGKWAHEGHLRLMGQFRHFGIVAMEKQIARNINMHGGGWHGVSMAFGTLVGAMAFVAPIYMARVAVQAIGRPDREEYLDRMLAPEQIARATLNYVSSAGLLGDFLDGFSAVTGVGQSAGGRGQYGAGVSSIVPALGVADDLIRTPRNVRELDAHAILKDTLPTRLPYIAPLVNFLDSED